mmetsp:Transcript_66262/g.144448  ORF Transcript_66262/g.144448 Transcript_66262/m.144448 type:complete len:147 (-) Transcript_66262:70-510(-)
MMAGIASLHIHSTVMCGSKADNFYMVPKECWLSASECARPAQRWEAYAPESSENSFGAPAFTSRARSNSVSRVLSGRRISPCDAIPNLVMPGLNDNEALSHWQERRLRRRKASPGSYGEMLRGHVMLSICLAPRVPCPGDESQEDA